MEGQERGIREYLRPDGRCPFKNWLGSLKDVNARARIRVRINRIRLGNFRDCNQWVAVSVNYGSTMDRNIEFTLVELVKSWCGCYAVDPKRVRKKILNSLWNSGTDLEHVDFEPIILKEWDGTTNSWQISNDDIVRARISSDLESDDFYGHPPLIVIDGKEIRWDEFGRMLMTYEGFHFKLEIFDRNEEMP